MTQRFNTHTDTHRTSNCSNCGRRGPLATAHLCDDCDRVQSAAHSQGVIR